MIDYKKERLLIISPHADDEVLGCGGLMAKVKDHGGEVYVLIFNIGAIAPDLTMAKKQTVTWKKENAEAMKYLKVDDFETVFESPEDNRFLDAKPLFTLINIIESESKVSIKKVKPTMVAIPTLHTHHQDHIKVFNAAIAALRPLNSPVPKTVISYEAPEYGKWSTYGSMDANFYVDIEKYIDKKIKGFYKYKSQVRVPGRDKLSIMASAEHRGREAGQRLCEAFLVHRHVI